MNKEKIIKLLQGCEEDIVIGISFSMRLFTKIRELQAFLAENIRIDADIDVYCEEKDINIRIHPKSNMDNRVSIYHYDTIPSRNINKYEI